MACGIFLNFEKLAISVIENEITQMTNNNVFLYEEKIEAVSTDTFSHNLYHGCIAAVFIVNFYETTLNTILRKLNCKETDIFKTSHEVKLQLICAMRGIDISEIKGNNNYGFMRSTVKLRNDIMHYKNNMLAFGFAIPAETTVPMGTTKLALAKLFTKEYMEQQYNGVYKLLELICEKCGLVLCKDCNIITNDGIDPEYEFVAQSHLGSGSFGMG